MADDYTVGRQPEFITTPRLLLDSVFTELVRAGFAEPLVLEQAPVRAPCICSGTTCFRDGVIGYIEGEHIEKLCTEMKQESGARGSRLSSFLDAHKKCHDTFMKERFARPEEGETYPVAMEDVEAWSLCIIDRMLDDGIETH